MRNASKEMDTIIKKKKKSNGNSISGNKIQEIKVNYLTAY